MCVTKACCVLRVACCVLRAARCVLRAACCVLRMLRGQMDGRGNREPIGSIAIGDGSRRGAGSGYGNTAMGPVSPPVHLTALQTARITHHLHLSTHHTARITPSHLTVKPIIMSADRCSAMW